MGADRRPPEPVTGRRPRARRCADDRGVVTAFVVIFAVALVFMCGLVVDGGRLLNAHRRARDVADSAARAGAQAISDTDARRGVIVLDPVAARAEACALLDRTPYTCRSGDATVHVDGDQVTVNIDGHLGMALLPGPSASIKEHGHACVAVGITTATC